MLSNILSGGGHLVHGGCDLVDTLMSPIRVGRHGIGVGPDHGAGVCQFFGVVFHHFAGFLQEPVQGAGGVCQLAQLIRALQSDRTGQIAFADAIQLADQFLGWSNHRANQHAQARQCAENNGCQ